MDFALLFEINIRSLNSATDFVLSGAALFLCLYNKPRNPFLYLVALEFLTTKLIITTSHQASYFTFLFDVTQLNQYDWFVILAFKDAIMLGCCTNILIGRDSRFYEHIIFLITLCISSFLAAFCNLYLTIGMSVFKGFYDFFEEISLAICVTQLICCASSRGFFDGILLHITNTNNDDNSYCWFSMDNNKSRTEAQ